MSCGQLICGGLFSNDSVSNWLCAVALSQECRHYLWSRHFIAILFKEVILPPYCLWNSFCRAILFLNLIWSSFCSWSLFHQYFVHEINFIAILFIEFVYRHFVHKHHFASTFFIIFISPAFVHETQFIAILFYCSLSLFYRHFVHDINLTAIFFMPFCSLQDFFCFNDYLKFLTWWTEQVVSGSPKLKEELLRVQLATQVIKFN